MRVFIAAFLVMVLFSAGCQESQGSADGVKVEVEPVVGEAEKSGGMTADQKAGLAELMRLRAESAAKMKAEKEEN